MYIYVYSVFWEMFLLSDKYVYSVKQKIRILGDSRNAYSRWFMKCIYSVIKQIKILGELRSVYTRWFNKFIYSVI